MITSTLQNVTKTVAKVLTRRQGFAPELAKELFNGREIQVTERNNFITPAGIVPRFSIRLHNGICFTNLDGMYITDANDWK
jgi:hypothetical protein